MNWQTVETLLPVDGLAQRIEANLDGIPHRFYRARLVD
jgi:hypothetical protein